MEHRCTPRISSDIKILISKHNLPIAIGRIRNGSRLGVFVETEFNDIECEQLLKFEVMHHKGLDHKLEPLEFQALVIHKGTNGFGAEIEFQSDKLSSRFFAMLDEEDLSTNLSDMRVVANQ